MDFIQHTLNPFGYQLAHLIHFHILVAAVLYLLEAAFLSDTLGFYLGTHLLVRFKFIVFVILIRVRGCIGLLQGNLVKLDPV